MARLRTCLFFAVLFCFLVSAFGAPVRIGFLISSKSVGELGVHDRGAWETAGELGEATLLLAGDGGFVDDSGAVRDLGEFDVLWHHQGDAIARSVLYRGPHLAAIKRFAAEGGGVLLSGGALAMVDHLGLEPYVRSQRHEIENWRDPAAMVAVEEGHPAFAGLEKDEAGLIWLSRGGCRALADFYWGGPQEGVVLGNTPRGVERPLVEYEVGGGRIVMFGWRWPDYADKESPHRRNLLRLTSNLLGYLGDPGAWRPVAIASDFPEGDARWRSLRRAIEDLSREFGDGYPRGAEFLRRLEELEGLRDGTKGAGAGTVTAKASATVDTDEIALAADGGGTGSKHGSPRASEDTAGIASSTFRYRSTSPRNDRWRIGIALHVNTGNRCRRKCGARNDRWGIEEFEELRREALLANPLLDFERLLMIRRGSGRLGLPMNFNGNDDLAPDGYENSVVALSMKDGGVETVFTPEGGRFIGDLDLHYDAGKMLVSTPDAAGVWDVAELDLERGELVRLPLIDEPDVHNYDACYLPDGRIAFTSTAPFIGVPCVGGRSKVANLYLRETDGTIRRLTNDQDHNWCPAVLNNGRILYLRWEYADIAHAFYRLLFHCAPDGSGQMEYYGSNSFWPTALFYTRPVPGHATKVVAVAGGHHEAPRQGELVVLDPARGRFEADGAVQRIPGYGEKVSPVILDGPIAASWPRFLHPYPLSEKYFIVSCKPSHDALWGVYLVDVFDNFVLLCEEPGFAMFEPTPWRKTERQPVIPDVADPEQSEATVLLADVYRGPGLAGVPRGAVKALRVFGYDYTFHGLGCEPDRVGLDGPWDVRRILGTVEVEPDGSASFQVPALTPVGVQPLDEEGKALQLMRSWFTAVPGEVLSCVGCHEKQNSVPPVDIQPSAFRRAPSAIEPWYGPARGFSFEREVQPVLDAYCIGCHDGAAAADLRAKPPERVPSAFQMHFSPSYMELRRWVHTPTLESDAHMLPPRDFHADTSPLVQILRDGHYEVALSGEAWDRLITWIDLNAPFHGTWKEVVASNETKLAAAKNGAERRREMNRRYSGFDADPEAVYPVAVLDAPDVVPFIPEATDKPEGFGHAAGMPRLQRQRRAIEVDVAEGVSLEKDLGRGAGVRRVQPRVVKVEIGEGVLLELVRIEPGKFVMGSENGYPNEGPARTVLMNKPFLMGRFEVTNRQYRCYRREHCSGLETGEAYQFGDDERGHTLDRPEQPVVRVSWEDAAGFCDWLSRKTGRRFSLPTEDQWEYACRASSASPMWYGGLDTDFSRYANLSDATHYTVYYPHVPTALPPWRPAETRFDDGWRVSGRVGAFEPNGWGLFDMHGNVSEWTRSNYARGERRKVVRGGSWLDCPKRSRSPFRLHYDKTQAVHDVGFRVVAAPW